MKVLTLAITVILSGSVEAQKPGLENSYHFKEVPKISLKNLRIPSTAGKRFYLDLVPNERSNPKAVKKRGPANSKALGQARKLSVSGACTKQDGAIVPSGDPNYDSCLDGSVYVKKVILTEPTQSILMNFNMDEINFNPFD